MARSRILRLSLLFAAFAASAAAVVEGGTCDAPSPSYPNIQAALDDATCTSVHIVPGFWLEPVTVNRSVEIYGDSNSTTGLASNGFTSVRSISS